MLQRKPLQYINHFQYPDTSKRWFQLNIEPVEEGIFILSVDITPQKVAEEKLKKIAGLYAFISQVNQNIVRVKDETTLFKNACLMALKFGKFKMAWIGLFDNENKAITVIEQCGTVNSNSKLQNDVPYQFDGPQHYVLNTGKNYICNDIENEIEVKNWKPFAKKFGIKSCMILPLKRSEKIIGTLNLYSIENNFAEKEEIALLTEVAGDISFALENFAKAKKQKESDKLIIASKKQHEFDRNNLKALINNTKDLMWSVDTEFKLITSNKSFDKLITLLLGKPIEKGSNLLLKDFPPDKVIGYKNLYERAFAGENFTEIEYTKPPNELWSEVSYCPIKVGEKVIGTACHSHNITQKKRAEQELRKSEAFNRGVLHSLKSLIAVIDIEGNIVAVNESWTRFAIENGDPELLHTGVGSNYYSVCQKSTIAGVPAANEVLQGITDVLNEKKTFFYLEYPCHSLEEQRWFAMRVTKFESDEQMVVISHQNISEQKFAEEKLITQNEELQKTNGELDRLVYSVSHDLRSPLTSVLGLLSFIEEESEETDTLNHAKMIRSSINRLDGFIKNILKYSHNNRTESSAVNIPIQKTIKEIIVSLKNMKGAEGIDFEVKIDEQHSFFSDVDRFNTVMDNLISNAIKYHKKDSENRYIKIIGKSDKNNLFLKIKDNGIGIAEEHHKKLFDMFYRLPSQVAGTGIGLYIVKEIIEKMKGSIIINSKEGIGTTFTIQLKNLLQ